MDALQGFWSKIDSDAGLAQEVDALFSEKTNAASAQAVVDLAARHGFVFSTDDLKTHLVGAKERELTDAELEAAAGGAWSVSSIAMKIEPWSFKIEIEGAPIRTIHF